MMPTQAQLMAFWTDANHIGLPEDVVASIEDDGVDDLESLVDFYERNLRPIQKRINRDDELNHFGERSFLKLVTACHAVRYYLTI